MRRLLLIAVTVAGCESGEDLDHDGVLVGEDCNDADPEQAEPEWLYVDEDGDGFAGDTQDLGCPGNAWLYRDATDCDDADATIHPAAVEVGCDARDNDCDPSSADGPAVSVGSTWPSIQQAIDAAGYHEPVELCASTVQEDLHIGRPIQLIGRGAGVTVLRGTGTGPTVHVAASGTVVSGVTVEGGIGLEVEGRRAGGGIVVAADLVTLDGVEVTGNEAVDGGGIAILPGASLALIGGSSVHDNTALGAGGGIHSEDAASLTLIEASVTQNLAVQGGGLWLRGTATLESSAISDNHANDGGGVALDSPESTSQLVGVHEAVLSGNSAVFGGAVWGVGDLVGVTIAENDAEHGGGVYANGAVGLFQSSLTENAAAATYDGSGGGVMLPPGTSLVASDVAMTGNTADGWGGAIMADAASLVLFGAQLESNVAEMGAGIALIGSCPTCMLEGNALDFRANVAHRGGGDILVYAPGSTVELTDVLLHAATAPTGAALSILGGSVDLLQVEVSAALSVEPDGAAIELAETGAWLGVAGGLFMGNDPADLRVFPFAPEPAPGPTFTCTGGTGCIVGP